jgi:hypothetical protein
MEGKLNRVLLMRLSIFRYKITTRCTRGTEGTERFSFFIELETTLNENRSTCGVGRTVSNLRVDR